MFVQQVHNHALRMKKLFLAILLSFAIGQKSFATEWLTYYIYIQKDYLQGPWTRAELLGKSNYEYLHPKQFEELFGSESISLANAILDHLRAETPERYAFRSTLALSADTVVIQTPDDIEGFDAVKNELAASFILNHFSAVKIIRRGKAALYGLKDITVPYMDLVLPGETAIPPRQKPDSIQAGIQAPAKPVQAIPQEKTGNKIAPWLILSLLVNLVVAILLLRRKK
jgi:hypothetical protein